MTVEREKLILDTVKIRDIPRSEDSAPSEDQFENDLDKACSSLFTEE